MAYISNIIYKAYFLGLSINPHVLLGKCLMTTSRAWIASIGICLVRPSSASSSANRLTWPTNLIPTLKTLSLPSPGKVTSNST